jgi:hypothetical protein
MGRWSDDGRGLAVCDSFGLSTDFHRLTQISCLATAVGLLSTDFTD